MPFYRTICEFAKQEDFNQKQREKRRCFVHDEPLLNFGSKKTVNSRTNIGLHIVERFEADIKTDLHARKTCRWFSEIHPAQSEKQAAEVDITCRQLSKNRLFLQDSGWIALNGARFLWYNILL